MQVFVVKMYQCDFCENIYMEFLFLSIHTSVTFVYCYWFTESTQKWFSQELPAEHVLRVIGFHNSVSAGAYMMFKGATSRTDVSSKSAATHFGLSVCLLYSLQTILGSLHVSSSAIPSYSCHKKETKSSCSLLMCFLNCSSRLLQVIQETRCSCY